jgi:parallel beta-helix repeat protein/predicted outer membrane repeat protein
MLRKMMVLMGVLALAGTSRAVMVDGYAYLSGQTNHEGIKVLFEAVTPSAVTDSTITDSSGYFQLDVAGGVYNIFYYYSEFLGGSIQEQPCFFSVTLPDMWLHIEITGGNLTGIIESGWYFISGDIYINVSDTLILKPGVRFFFQGDYEFTIEGVLLAQGTFVDSIRFVPVDSVDHWQGLDFSGSISSSSEISYCIIRNSVDNGISCFYSDINIFNCTISDNSGDYGGGVSCFYSNPHIIYCTIKFNTADIGGGIYCSESSPDIIDCTISDNSNIGIFCENNSNVTITDCTVNYNSGTFGGGINCSSANLIISNCTLDGNSAGWGGGIYCYYSNTNISYCIFNNNSANSGGGIYCSSDNPIISDCNFSNNSATNYYGGGIYCFYANPFIINCTFTSNSAVEGGGGIGCRNNSNPETVDFRETNIS